MDSVITIIVPVYNTEKYLPRCIDSVLKQSYKNFVLMLINDGSTDGSAKICQEYVNIDDRIVFINKDNSGVSSTRNYGIDLCNTEYITFVDSDDFVSKNYLEELLLKIGGNDLSCSSYYYYCENGNKRKAVYCGENEVEVLTREEAIISALREDGIRGFCCRALFKTDVIKKNNIRFRNDILYCEDVVFFIQYLSLVDKIVYLDRPLYYYFVRSNSATASFGNAQRTVDLALDALNKTSENIDNLDVSIAIKDYCANAYFYVYQSAIMSKTANKVDKRKYKKALKMNFKHILTSKSIKKDRKILAFVMLYFKNTFTLLKKIKGIVK